MRLLDLIAQGHCAAVRSEDGRELPGAARFIEDIRNCPLRFVLSDELARCCTQLAYAEGDRLSSCLDLLHVPARSLWVEWADGPRRKALEAIPALEVPAGVPACRAGALVTASPDCRSGRLRTFWSTNERAYLSPTITVFDFDRRPEPPARGGRWVGDVVLGMHGEPALQDLLDHLRFRFDDEWARYYRDRCTASELRIKVLRAALASCAFDAPMLMGFFLLLGARGLLPRSDVSQERINRVRCRAGKPGLLEHVEVSAPLAGPAGRPAQLSGEPSRLGPRLHHVRGHIVRRGPAVFWRAPHLRGNARAGLVRSRTVMLNFEPARFSGAAL